MKTEELVLIAVSLVARAAPWSPLQRMLLYALIVGCALALVVLRYCDARIAHRHLSAIQEVFLLEPPLTFGALDAIFAMRSTLLCLACLVAIAWCPLT